MSPIPPSRHRANDQRLDLWLFFLAAFILIAAGIGLRDPWPADEPRFAMVAKQMVETGAWLIPHRGSELYADKPPLFMVLEAAAFELTHNWRLAFLLPSLLASMGMLGLIYDLARRLWNHRAGMYAAAALLATFQFVYQAKRAQIDPTVTFFMTLANYGLLRHMLLGPAWRWYVLGCAAAGLGVITKGVGVLCLLMFVPYLYACRSNWLSVASFPGERLRWLAGLAAFLVPLALWVVPVLVAVWSNASSDYHAYAREIFLRQTLGRYSHSWDHFQPPWFYLGVVTLSWIPLSLTYPATIPLWYRRLRARDARFLLPLAWVGMLIVFFSITTGKRDVYIMPALPWVALATAPFLPAIVKRAWLRTAALALAVLVGLGLLGSGVALLARPDMLHVLALRRGVVEAQGGLPWLLVALGAAALVPAAALGVWRGVHALLAALAGLWLLWSFFAYPLLNDPISGAGVMRRVGAVVGPDAEVGMVAWKEQEIYLADRKVAEFGFLEPYSEQLSRAILWQRAAPDRRWIFILGDAMGSCVDPEKAVSVGIANRNHWWLFRRDAINPACRDGTVPYMAGEPRS